MRIAHISDLHLSAVHKRSNIRRAKALLEHIARIGVDHVVVTGDIAADAKREDLLLARKLFHAQGLLDSRLLSVVIGNHDVYGGVHTAEDVLEFPRRCRKTDVHKKVEQFHDVFHEVFDGTQFATADSPFPYVKPLGDLLIIGLNSAAPYSTVKNPVGSNGAIDQLQRDRLDRLLSFSPSRGSGRIVLIHHHFNKMQHRTDGTMQSMWKAFEQRTMKLHGKRTLMKLFESHGVDIVLHGHYHRNVEYVRKGIRFVNGGGSTLSLDSSSLHLNLLHVDRRGIRIQHHGFPLMNERQGSPSRETISLSALAAA
jgi:3',5'-cyclic-AMP phosphodiesterase